MCLCVYNAPYLHPSAQRVVRVHEHRRTHRRRSAASRFDQRPTPKARTCVKEEQVTYTRRTHTKTQSNTDQDLASAPLPRPGPVSKEEQVTETKKQIPNTGARANNTLHK